MLHFYTAQQNNKLMVVQCSLKKENQTGINFYLLTKQITFAIFLNNVSCKVS